ncbi:MAG: hypothetical protein K940chlam9_01733 [Chlamydiae bacterium]|nr:hypothetical protein [Chlamydiota bacterium]
MMICTHTTIELETRNGAFVCQGKQFASQEKVHEYLKSSCHFDMIKVVEETKSYFLHRSENGFERYETRGSVRKALSREAGGAWVELSGKKVRYFLDKGWIFSSIQKVNKEKFLSRLEPQDAKIAGIVLGMFALGSLISEVGRVVGKEDLVIGLATYKYPALGLALSMISKVDAQAMGTEFQANTYTTSDQRDPSTTALSDGGFVVVWESDGQDGDSYGIFGQRYGQNGTLVGSEFQVNTYTTSAQNSPSITALSDGGFVVTWQSNGQDGDSEGIYGQRYDRSVGGTSG